MPIVNTPMSEKIIKITNYKLFTLIIILFYFDDCLQKNLEAKLIIFIHIIQLTFYFDYHVMINIDINLE